MLRKNNIGRKEEEHDMTRTRTEYNLPAANDNARESGNRSEEMQEDFQDAAFGKTAFTDCASAGDKTAELSYPNDEELDRLIADTERSGMLTAPSFLKREVIREIHRRKNVSQMNAVRLKTWQIVTVVAAAILFLTVMPLEQRTSGQSAPGIPGNIRQESVFFNREPDAKADNAKEQKRQDVVGDWMYEKNLQVGAAVRRATDHLLPAAINSRSDAASRRGSGDRKGTN